MSVAYVFADTKVRMLSFAHVRIVKLINYLEN